MCVFKSLCGYPVSVPLVCVCVRLPAYTNVQLVKPFFSPVNAGFVKTIEEKKGLVFVLFYSKEILLRKKCTRTQKSNTRGTKNTNKSSTHIDQSQRN